MIGIGRGTARHCDSRMFPMLAIMRHSVLAGGDMFICAYRNRERLSLKLYSSLQTACMWLGAGRLEIFQVHLVASSKLMTTSKSVFIISNKFMDHHSFQKFFSSHSTMISIPCKSVTITCPSQEVVLSPSPTKRWRISTIWSEQW